VFARTQWLPEEQALAKIASSMADGPFDLHVYPWVEPDEAQPAGWRCVVPVGLLTPWSRGRLRLRSADPVERAQVDHAYLAEAADVAALAYGVRWALQVIRQPEIAAYLGSPLRFPPGPLDDTLDMWIRSTHPHYWHPAGTCRMGPDPARLSTRSGVYMACGAFASLTPRCSLSSRAPRRRCPWQSSENGLPT
jgi:choline dehydrogenase